MTETQKAIEAEAEELYPSLSHGGMIHQITESHYIKKLRSVHIAGRSKSLEEKEKRVRELEDALRECEEYFDNKSDVDHDGENYVPNKEAKLLSQITKLLYNH